MELIIDTADVKQIKELCSIFNVDGVTTNPSIICKEKRDFNEIINDIIATLKAEQSLFIEVLADKCEDMIAEAEYINNLRPNTYAKIPVSEQGLQAIKICKEKNLKVLATAVFTATQAYLAGKNGADYIAPYVNRMSRYLDGVEETIMLQKIIHDNNFNTKVVGAGFKNANSVKILMANGIDAVTVAPDIFRNLYQHEGTQDAIKGFEEDWLKQYGRKTLL